MSGSPIQPTASARPSGRWMLESHRLQNRNQDFECHEAPTSFCVFCVKRLIYFVGIWVNVAIIKFSFIKSLWTVDKNWFIINKNKVWTLNHVLWTTVIKVKISNFFPIFDVVVYSFVKFHKAWFVIVLSAYDCVELTFIVEDLWVTEVSVASGWRDKNVIHFSDLVVFIHPSTDLKWVTYPVFVTNISCIEQEEFVIADFIGRTRVSSVAIVFSVRAKFTLVSWKNKSSDSVWTHCFRPWAAPKANFDRTMYICR